MSFFNLIIEPDWVWAAARRNKFNRASANAPRLLRESSQAATVSAVGRDSLLGLSGMIYAGYAAVSES